MLSILLEYIGYKSLLTGTLCSYVQMVYNSVSVGLFLLSKVVIFIHDVFLRYSVFIN